MKPSLVFVALVAGIFYTGCADPTKDQPQARTEAAVAETVKAPVTAPAPAEAPLSFTLNPANTTVGFVGSKVTGSHTGNFGAFTGMLKLRPGDPAATELSVDIDMNSVTTDNEKLTGHLKSPDFFEVAKFPRAKFSVTSVKPGGEGNVTHTITGNLTLKETTKSISFPATVSLNGKAVSMTTQFAINRKDFGIVYPGMPDDLIRDNVLLKLKLNANAD